jgi:hypothetical protein
MRKTVIKLSLVVELCVETKIVDCINVRKRGWYKALLGVRRVESAKHAKYLEETEILATRQPP